MFRTVLSILLISIVSFQSAYAGKRIALLIGNKSYAPAVGPLKNPHNDIKLVGAALKKAGFEVLPLVRDATRLQVLAQVRAFARKLKAAGPGAVGFFYYSGHGAAETRIGPNYIIPVNVRSTTDASIWDSSVKLDNIIARLKGGAPNAKHFIVFDACRNELKTRDKSLSKGFVAQGAEDGVYISFATAENDKASDVGEGSGPYAKALAEELVKPGQHHLDMFLNIKQAVYRATGQRPWDRNGLLGRVYFGGKLTACVPGEIEKELWRSVKAGNGTEDYREYLKAFPRGCYAPLARVKLRRVVAALQKLPVPKKPMPNKKPVIQNTVGVYPDKFVHGYKFDDCNGAGWCPKMIVVRGDTFTMGAAKSEKLSLGRERPQQEVRIKKFAVGRFEVTNAEYVAFLNDIGRRGTKSETWFKTKAEGSRSQITGSTGSFHVEAGKENFPVVNVSWYGAKAYVDWLSRKTGKTYRLPTEVEWEYVASAKQSTSYWWGDSISQTQAKYSGDETVSVDSFKPNPFGLYNVHGNVYEWVEDCWHWSYSNAPADGSAWLEANGGDCKLRVLRGGSWVNSPQILRARSRFTGLRDLRSDFVGFRVARALASN